MLTSQGIFVFASENRRVLSRIRSAVAGTGPPTNITGSPSVPARIVVTGNPHRLQSGHRPLEGFNPTAFALPATGTLGDTSKNLVRGPGIENWNISLVKELPVWDRVRL